MANDVISLVQQALWLVLLLSGPPILAAVLVSLLVSFIQAATQLQEQTTQFAVKLIVIAVALLVTLSLIGSSMYNFADRIFSDFGSMIG